MKKRKTPQEKKLLSLKKDRRNSYGENAKASRKAIPLRKRNVNKQNRKRQHDIVALMAHAETEEDLEATESLLLQKRNKQWQKTPDVSLSEKIKHTKFWRILREGRKSKARNSAFNHLNVDDPRLDEYE